MSDIPKCMVVGVSMKDFADLQNLAITVVQRVKNIGLQKAAGTLACFANTVVDFLKKAKSEDIS